MDNYGIIRIQELEDNPTPRVPICLCLDTSYSMNAVHGDCVQTGRTITKDGRTWNIVEGGITNISDLQDGINQFYREVNDDELAIFAADICIVEFNDTASCLRDFESVERQMNKIPQLSAEGETAMGEGVNLALNLLEARKKEYADKGVDYFQPWLVLMTDGSPTGDANELERAIVRTNKLIRDKKLILFPIGIGDADMDVLRRFSPDGKAYKLSEMKFREFFEWLAQSTIKASQSMPGESLEELYSDANISGWSEPLPRNK